MESLSIYFTGLVLILIVNQAGLIIRLTIIGKKLDELLEEKNG